MALGGGRALATADLTLMLGSQVREYVFQKLLGEGGMGQVYLCEHTLLRDKRAVKLLHRQLTLNPAVVQRFVNEARAVARLRGSDGKPHRNLIQVYELFQDNGTWYMVMEYLEGRTLSKVIESQGGPMPLDRVVHAVGGIANALKVAHANGIIHRDLKPENVFVTVRERDTFHIVLLDFGVAQLRNDPESGPITKAGTIIGTPHFMAPEQLAGRSVTAATDIFALGIIAYMMVTGGKHPWQYEDLGTFFGIREPELYNRMMTQPPIDPRRYAPHLTEEQAQAVLAPLDKEPGRRPASAAAYAILLGDRVPTDGFRSDGLEILRSRYPELFDIDNMLETVRSVRPPSSMPISSGFESKYKLVKRLGAGGMAEVYLATIEIEGYARPVAIKRVLPGLAEASPELARMFTREAQIIARLSHPNIIQVIDFSRDPQDRPFLVMEYVDGKDLASLLEAGPVSPSLAIFLATEILRGLGYAHELPDAAGQGSRGIVHRDISPHNVLVSYEGAVKVCDFGLARVRSASNASVNAVGKPAYMSPEQVEGVPDLDGRCDLFAVGVMLHEMLTGQPLFSGTHREIAGQVAFKEIVPPSRIKRHVPPALDAIVMRLLARDRNARYQRAEEAVKDLVQCGHAPTDGRGELVRLLTTRFPKSDASSSAPGSIAAPTSAATPAAKAAAGATVSQPSTTLGAAASESIASVKPSSRKGAYAVIAGLCVVIASGLGFVYVKARERASERIVAANARADAAPPTAPSEQPAAVAPPVDASPSITTPIVATNEPARAAVAIVDAGVESEVARPDAGTTDAPAPSPSRPDGSRAGEKDVPRTSPKRRQTGELVVRCDPWCDIWIDGVKKGTSPKVFTLPVGPHRVRLVNPDVQQETSKKVMVTAEKQMVVEESW